MEWDVIDLGRLAYAPALAVQRRRNAALIAGEARPALLLVEHEPVITLTSRRGVRDHLLAPPQVLQDKGIAVEETDRGGDITYHGPGQLVAYPILRLADHGLNLSRYMRWMEQAVIDTAATFGVSAHSECGATGVWVGSGQWGVGSGEENMERADSSPPHCSLPVPHPPAAKLCAMGVRIRKGTTLHGLALNVTTDLSHFSLIDPCGLGGRPVTSLLELLGEGCPSMDRVKATLVAAMERLLDAGAEPSDPQNACQAGLAGLT